MLFIYLKTCGFNEHNLRTSPQLSFHQSLYGEANANMDVELAPPCTDKINSLVFHPNKPMLLAACWNNLVISHQNSVFVHACVLGFNFSACACVGFPIYFFKPTTYFFKPTTYLCAQKYRVLRFNCH